LEWGLFGMASVRDRLESLVLSANDLSALTGWPDAMIEDYLNILRNIILVATSTDINDTQIEVNKNNIATNTTEIGINSTDISSNTAGIGDNSTDISTLQSGKANKSAPATTNNIATLSGSGDLQDGGDLISDLVTIVGTGNPNGVVTSNKSLQSDRERRIQPYQNQCK